MLFLILNTSDPRSSEHKDGIVASAPLTERLLSGYNSKFLMVGSLVIVQWRVFWKIFLRPYARMILVAMQYIPIAEEQQPPYCELSVQIETTTKSE
jgi:hypothetical protein